MAEGGVLFGGEGGFEDGGVGGVVGVGWVGGVGGV